MEYDHNRVKGTLDKSFPSVKLAFHKDCSAAVMLTKCKDSVWPEESAWPEASNNYQYYIADGTGTAVGLSAFNIDLPSGAKETLPWTLSNYLKVSNIKYPSRLRLYCVRKLTSMFCASMLIICS